MFAWLDLVLELIRRHPETLFVIRAHPDESRPGKESRESVSQWVQDNHVLELPNVVFIDASQPFSSYELIQKSKFAMVYNSTIGLEAVLLGVAVLSGGRARYTPYQVVYSPATPEAYRQQAEAFLDAEHIDVPPEFNQNARRFLYFQLYCTSLPFQSYLTSEARPGYVNLRDFNWSELLPDKSPTMKVILDGILEGKPFLIDDGQ